MVSNSPKWSQMFSNGPKLTFCGVFGYFGVKMVRMVRMVRMVFQTLLVVTSADGISHQHVGLLHLGWACFWVFYSIPIKKWQSSVSSNGLTDEHCIPSYFYVFNSIPMKKWQSSVNSNGFTDKHFIPSNCWVIYSIPIKKSGNQESVAKALQINIAYQVIVEYFIPFQWKSGNQVSVAKALQKNIAYQVMRPAWVSVPHLC